MVAQLKRENKYCLRRPESVYCFRALMKPIVAFAVVIAFAGGTFADIQDPPSNDYGPTRKLGRGLSNFFIAPAEVFVTVTTINTYDGNSAAAGYGVVRGVGRSGARHIAGLIEMLTFPFPDRKSTRLNSSHQIISYAVFCLKKKNSYGIV